MRCIRKGAVEALTGAHAGRAIEPRKHQDPGADVVIVSGRPRDPKRECEPRVDPARSKNPSMYAISRRENREIPSLPEADGDLGTRREGQGRTPPANELGKSHRPIVPTRPVNEVGEETTAEPVEGRGPAKENASQQSTHRTQSRARVSQALEDVRQAAKRNKGEKFTALLHHVTKDRLGEASWELNKKAADGVDGVTWEQYGANLEESLQGLHQRLHRGAYRANPVGECTSPRPTGREGRWESRRWKTSSCRERWRRY